MSKKLGTIIKEARTAKKLTQAALAEQVDGLTASDVSKIERGEKEPETAVLKKMAKPLGLTQASLLEAASGKTTTSGKTSTSKKTSSSGKTASNSSSVTLTAKERRLITGFRKADSNTKETVLKILEGEASAADYIGLLAAGKLSSLTGSAQTASASGKDDDDSSGKDSGMSSMLEGLLGSLMKK